MEPGTSQWTAMTADSYELAKWILQWLGRMPRNHRFGLGKRIEESSLDLVEHLIDARFGYERGLRIELALRKSNHLRFQLRLAFDLGLLTANQLEHCLKWLVPIGRRLAATRTGTESAQ